MTDLPNNSLTNNNPDDWSWLAFQYVSNELSEQEAVEFEELLAQKQEAREALAAATQLIAGLKSMESVPTVKTPAMTTSQASYEMSPVSSFRSQQWALASCAAVILLITTFLLTKPASHEATRSQIVQTEPSEEDLEHVLDLWSESAEDSSISISASNSSGDLIDQQNILAENQTLEIPDWLYTAVSLPEESVN